MSLTRLVSGGQTGVDRAALDAALEAALDFDDLRTEDLRAEHFEVGGWCPKGRRAEDGPLPVLYPLHLTLFAAYAQRTEWNVRDSDATLIFTRGPLTGGTALTAELAEKYERPHLVVNLNGEGGDAYVGGAHAGGDGEPGPIADRIARWLEEADVETLNVAGPRESGEPGIYEAVRPIVRAVLRRAVSP